MSQPRRTQYDFSPYCTSHITWTNVNPCYLVYLTLYHYYIRYGYIQSTCGFKLEKIWMRVAVAYSSTVAFSWGKLRKERYVKQIIRLFRAEILTRNIRSTKQAWWSFDHHITQPFIFLKIHGEPKIPMHLSQTMGRFREFLYINTNTFLILI
jgi:hypothetical protein